MDSGVKKAYQSLLILSLYKPVSAEFQQFDRDVRRKAMENYGFDYGQEEVGKINES